jgi:tetratricopeptide (TPR) repeat protein
MINSDIITYVEGFMKKIIMVLMVLLLVGCQSEIEDQNKEAVKLIRQGHYTEALNILKSALESDENDDTTWNNISVCYDAIGEYQLALEAAQEAVNLGKEKAAEYANLGNAYYDLGSVDEAKLAYSKALDIDDEYFFALFGMGVYYTESEEYEEALEYFENLYNNNPLNIDVVRYIAFCQYKSGRVDASIVFLEDHIEKVNAPDLTDLLLQIKEAQKK